LPELEENLPEPVGSLNEDIVEEKFAHNLVPPPLIDTSLEEKKQRLLEKLQSFQADDSTD